MPKGCIFPKGAETVLIGEPYPYGNFILSEQEALDFYPPNYSENMYCLSLKGILYSSKYQSLPKGNLLLKMTTTQIQMFHLATCYTTSFGGNYEIPWTRKAHY